MRTLLSLPIAKRMLDLRIRHGFNQKQMGEILGINQSQYSKYERGHQTISCCQICQLSAWFGIEPGWFFETIRDQLLQAPVCCEIPVQNQEAAYNRTVHPSGRGHRGNHTKKIVDMVTVGSTQRQHYPPSLASQGLNADMLDFFVAGSFERIVIDNVLN